MPPRFFLDKVLGGDQGGIRGAKPALFFFSYTSLFFFFLKGGSRLDENPVTGFAKAVCVRLRG